MLPLTDALHVNFQNLITNVRLLPPITRTGMCAARPPTHVRRPPPHNLL